jgi:hypothetical protein
MANVVGALLDAPGGHELMLMTNHFGATSLITAARHPNRLCVEMLCERGGMELMMSCDDKGWSCLNWAVRCATASGRAHRPGDEDVVQYLCRSPAGAALMGLSDHCGRPCMFLAIHCNNNADAVRCLWEEGMAQGLRLDMQLDGRHNASCLAYASTFEGPKVVEFLCKVPAAVAAGHHGGLFAHGDRSMNPFTFALHRRADRPGAVADKDEVCTLLIKAAQGIEQERVREMRLKLVMMGLGLLALRGEGSPLREVADDTFRVMTMRCLTETEGDGINVWQKWYASLVCLWCQAGQGCDCGPQPNNFMAGDWRYSQAEIASLKW